MSEPNKSKVTWDFQLNFDLPEVKMASSPSLKIPPRPPRHVLKEKFPRIHERIDWLWGSLELHKYLEQTLFTVRSDRQGFPKEVMLALGEIHHEHLRILKSKGVLKEDVWDVQS